MCAAFWSPSWDLPRFPPLLKPQFQSTIAHSRIIELAHLISENTSTIENALVAHKLPTPSFDPAVSVTFPADITVARDIVLDATQELHDLLIPPMNLIQRKASYNKLACMKAISRYSIQNCLDVGETKTYAELATACGLSERPLKHLLRHAMTMRIFAEPRKGVVAHTAVSQLMRNHDCKAWLELGTEDLWPSSVKLVDALGKWPDSEEPNHTGWNIAHNAPEPLYERLAADPKMAARMGASMSATITNNPAFDPVHLQRSFDWEALGSSLVVDVGGSHGTVAISLAEKYKNLRLISQDLVSTIDSAAPVPGDVADRVQLMTHDFFTPQPVEAEAYLFRQVFHNHSDKYAALILKALIPPLKRGVRILVQDACLPDPGTIPGWREIDIRDMDLLVKTSFNAWERDADEWRELFAKADSRFEFVRITQPQGSALALIEARWTGEA
ncbi:S-adenosyl-L-methionine-dependent methyltransferase [Lentithecium fluviatile CBS 122367]|uniref:S-adenosyl-L-methionine-dependent methyltransferase n=1 Tax=Lentithecium fluviatile CBS 122367 TaxID=1168545 RepID=A0A6G1IRT3_9PLEO|nr:S-adenosyl-L-methionine-dependent methyltransferase [Lentithecium fluviatile CBS 122367]